LSVVVADPFHTTEATAMKYRLYGQRSAFMREEMTGFVWLYLQK
jgi:hypothetical protein